MATDVVMPQMGESIFEGTITKWLKKPGDKVQRDEPLFEISTDKVDAEIPAPAAGILKEIKVSEGATVQVNTVVGIIDAEGSGAAAAPAQPAQSAPKAAPSQSPQADGATAAQQPPATEKSAPVQEAQQEAQQTSAPAGANGGAGTDVVMPQMGESIFEGTITKWLKKVGDKVQRDEPLFEISTDKVDAEIPAPAAGVLSEIKVKEGTTVQVNSVVAVIGGGGGAAKPAPAQAAPPKQAAAPQAPQQQHRRRQGRKPFHNRFPLLAAMRRALTCAHLRWFAAWRVRIMLISARFPEPVWAGASARTIFKALSSNTDKVEPGRKQYRRRRLVRHSRRNSNKRHSKRHRSLLRRHVRQRLLFNPCPAKQFR